ncbi:MAG: biotin--[acetyl-CoA-carboxylase] ligase [Saprospiraceae bacterium]|nr:biotin--[acetyl-CoA-carboxylase] ligase [Saprospiraceae bacterium]MDW8484119.1 biotin--[acetyl-CoA-carboxylase] ligase [Saprospiraceae bacterium]
MENNLFIGKVRYVFDTLPSTNDFLTQLLLTKSKPPEGTIAYADNQTDGRGQYGSRWYSAAGENLLLSILLYPTWLPASEQWLLSEAMVVAVRETVEEVAQCSAHIKWPNDVYLGERKTAGLLIQCGLSGAQIQHAIVGVGLNVNQTQFPPEVPNGTSLALACGRAFDRNAILEHLLRRIEQRYVQLRHGHREPIRRAYRDHLLGLGQQRRFAYPDGRFFEGTPEEVLSDGRLVVQSAQGKVVFATKELIWLMENE